MGASKRSTSKYSGGLSIQSADATYTYRDVEGTECFLVTRHEKPGGGKDIRPWHRDGHEWVRGGTTTLLYRLPEILASPDAPVFVVEGEKCADTLAAHGLIATTNAGGAGKWKPEHSEQLRGRDVVIFPDNDERGREHAAKVTRSLAGVAASARVVDLPGLPEKGDIVDWLAAGRTVDQMLDLADQTPEYRPAPDATPDPALAPWLDTITAADLMAMTFPETRWAVPGLFPEGLTFLVGSPKVGKSWLSLNVAVAVGAGGYALGKIGVDAGDVLYLALEDTNRRLNDRLNKITQPDPELGRVHFRTEWPTLKEGGVEAIARWLETPPRRAPRDR